MNKILFKPMTAIFFSFLNISKCFYLRTSKIKMNEYTTMFFHHIHKGEINFRDFLFASLDDDTLPELGLLLNERICS